VAVVRREETSSASFGVFRERSSRLSSAISQDDRKHVQAHWCVLGKTLALCTVRNPIRRAVAPLRREASQWQSGDWANDAWLYAVTGSLHSNSGRELSAFQCHDQVASECRTSQRRVLTYFVLVPRSDATPGLRALCYRHLGLSHRPGKR
jgi:hypothetical protein